MKAGENLSYACLKMELGEQAELLYRALTEQDFKIEERRDCIKTVTNAKEAEEYQIDVDISKGFEEFTKMMFKSEESKYERTTDKEMSEKANNQTPIR